MSAAPVDELPLVESVPVDHLVDMHVDLLPAQVITTPVGLRMVFITTGGTIDGPALKGQILPGGGDWLLVSADGVGRVDVRATIRTNDGVLIHYEAGGVIKIPPGGLERLGAGEVLPFAETYIRTTPRFETSDKRYRWLTEIVAVGYNILSPDHIDYRIYRLK